METLLTNLTAKFDPVDNRTTLLQASIRAVRTYMLIDSHQGPHSIETALQHENLLTRAELTSLRDISRKAITENELTVAVDRLPAFSTGLRE